MSRSYTYALIKHLSFVNLIVLLRLYNAFGVIWSSLTSN